MSDASPASPGFSVVILTLDEEVNVTDCIRSCAGCDDIHVLDSGSKDRTCELAVEHGAKVWVNPFRSFGAQRNWAIDNIPLRHAWVLHLDADERLTREGIEELRRTVASNPNEAGYHLPSKLIFMGRWLRRAGSYPTFQMRFFHKGRMRFTDYGHGQRELTEGTVGTLREPYLHLAFSKGVDDWFAKHNRYSTQEAQQALEVCAKPIPWGDMLSRDRVARRRALKALAYRVPFRAPLRWLVMAFLWRGILEGRAGLTYISMVTTYERMTAIKLAWMRAERVGSPPRAAMAAAASASTTPPSTPSPPTT